MSPGLKWSRRLTSMIFTVYSCIAIYFQPLGFIQPYIFHPLYKFAGQMRQILYGTDFD